jgi:hypothetical protein
MSCVTICGNSPEISGTCKVSSMLCRDFGPFRLSALGQQLYASVRLRKRGEVKIHPFWLERACMLL